MGEFCLGPSATHHLRTLQKEDQGGNRELPSPVLISIAFFIKLAVGVSKAMASNPCQRSKYYWPLTTDWLTGRLSVLRTPYAYCCIPPPMSIPTWYGDHPLRNAGVVSNQTDSYVCMYVPYKRRPCLVQLFNCYLWLWWQVVHMCNMCHERLPSTDVIGILSLCTHVCHLFCNIIDWQVIGNLSVCVFMTLLWCVLYR